jgi:hypothetical protein
MRTMMKTALFRFCAMGFVLLTCMLSPSVHAQGFAALISPPRFELSLKPGETTRQIIEINHTGNQIGRYRAYTTDWTFGTDATVNFSEALRPDSCRPWVAIERKELSIAPNNKLRYRFEVTAPSNTPAMECRFAIMIEGLDQVVETKGALSFPVSGRVGVIVYVAVGDVAAKLEIAESRITRVDANDVPTLMVRNSGNAHGRMSGFLSGTDAQGRKLEFTPSTLPILPGETRAITLTPSLEGSTAPEKVSYPVTIKGNLEWGDKLGNKSLPYEQRFSP